MADNLERYALDGSTCESFSCAPRVLRSNRGELVFYDEARDQIQKLTADNERLRDFIESEGYRRCDVAGCNCGSFHGGHAMARLNEIGEALPYSNGSTILQRAQKLTAENERLRSQLEKMEQRFDQEKKTTREPDDAEPDQRDHKHGAHDVPDGYDSGRVRWYNPAKGFGFIIPDRGGSDVFVHVSGIRDGKILQSSEPVVYRFVPYPKGPIAEDVR